MENKKTHLMILGDVRIGDCFHIGTYLNKLKYDYNTTWVHGTYEKLAVRFMRDYCELGITETVEKPSICLSKHQSIPMNLNSVNMFLEEYKVCENGFHKVTANSGPLFFTKNDDIIFRTKNLPAIETYKDYIIVHASSISGWKNIEALNNLPLKGDAYGVGPKAEKCPKNVVDMRGAPLELVASLMLKAKCVVAIHSSMACLAFHLGVPLITCLFWDGEGGQLKFSDYRENCIEIVYPTEEKIMDAIHSFGGE